MKTPEQLLIENIRGVIQDWNDGGEGDVDALLRIDELLGNAGYPTTAEAAGDDEE